MRALFVAAVLTFSLVAVGCGGGEQGKTPMKMEDVPPEAMKAAKEKLPEVTFTDAFREPNGHIELRGKDKKGKVYEIDVSPDGKSTKIE
jgi:hypothetical protein